jgi:hypothetical protein
MFRFFNFNRPDDNDRNDDQPEGVPLPDLDEVRRQMWIKRMNTLYYADPAKPKVRELPYDVFKPLDEI